MDESHILTCRNVDAFVEAARPHILRPDHHRIGEPCPERLPRPLRDLEADRLVRLALDERGALLDLAGGVDVCDFQLHQIAAAQLAVDRCVEECGIPDPVSNLESNPDRLYML